MASNKTTVKSSCLCGKAKQDLTFPTSDLPLEGAWCHCESCRHMTGTLCLTTVTLPDNYEPPKELLNELTSFEFSPRLTQYFCKTCGSQIMAHLKHSSTGDKGPHWDVMTGTLEKQEGVFALSESHFIADTIDGGFSDFILCIEGRRMQRWPLRPHADEELSLYWQSPDRPQVKPDPSDKLHCHCKCGGVNFWIARPSERSKKAASPWPDLIYPYPSEEWRSDKSNWDTWWLRDNGTKFMAGNCCCNSCRLDSGMEFVNWCFIPTIDISLDAEGKVPFELPFGTLMSYNSSNGVERWHCGTCGASAFFTSEERDGLIDIGVGLLDAPEGSRAGSWLDWSMERLSFREDAVHRAPSLMKALEKGQKEWAARQKK